MQFHHCEFIIFYEEAKLCTNYLLIWWYQSWGHCFQHFIFKGRTNPDSTLRSSSLSTSSVWLKVEPGKAALMEWIAAIIKWYLLGAKGNCKGKRIFWALKLAAASAEINLLEIHSLKDLMWLTNFLEVWVYWILTLIILSHYRLIKLYWLCERLEKWL